MASTTVPSKKRDPAGFEIKKSKKISSIRRWFQVLKHATFKNRQNDVDCLKIKGNHEPSAPNSATSSTSSAENDKEEPNEPNRPLPTTAPKPKPTLPPVPEVASTDSSSSASPASPSKPFPTTPAPTNGHKHAHQPRQPTMITPELLQQIETSNRKHSGATLLDSDELRAKKMDTATLTNRAKAVIASPLRWSER